MTLVCGLEVVAVLFPQDADAITLELCGGAVSITYRTTERILEVCGSEVSVTLHTEGVRAH
jgi:hypothetical protein